MDRSRNAYLTKMAPRLTQQELSQWGMLLLAVGRAQEVLEEAMRPLDIFNRTNLNQHVDAPRSVSNAGIDLLWVIACRQQERPCRVIRGLHTIQRIQDALHFFALRDKHLEIFNQ